MSVKRVKLSGDEPVVVQIVGAVASILDIPTSQLPPLENTIDAELLELLTDRNNDALEEGSLTFDYAGVTITVYAEKKIQIRI